MSNRSVINRRNIILKRLNVNERVLIGELASSLNVSVETIRKDLIAMEQQGILKREHGAAVLISENEEEAIEFRNMDNLEIKNRIAHEALKYIPKSDNTIIAIDAGSTTWCLARLLAQRSGQNIITSSIPVAELFNKDTNNVYMLGGLVRQKDKSVYGQWTLNCMNSVGISVSVLGSGGTRSMGGLCAVTFDDADLKRAMVRNSEFSIALLDSSKFQKRSLVEAVKWEDIDYVITDSNIDEEERVRLSKRTKLIVV
ncbi:DeoR family transcriptional regulator [Alkalibaculum sp. M08DMB]|uniref:DeoR family transcriptional regulator n=1 Tax=Alkalibaculum sporogenes TaxID=2655001 RepID=A0A6A7K774_9FIRM|nr:DeoR/GlpR family DNA-binding transcription regulator [Alkalibaculum sporogenes]MPW25235.1 DeoR family transcriptional regulator [Alkalibaculum sporogenes]